VAEAAEADVVRPLRERAEHAERERVDGELLEPRVLEAGEHLEAQLVGLDADLDHVPDDLRVIAAGGRLELGVRPEAKGHRPSSLFTPTEI